MKISQKTPRRRRQRRRLVLCVLAANILTAVSVAALTYWAFAPEQVEHNRYLVACVKSDAEAQVHFQYRWGRQGAWTNALAHADHAVPLALPLPLSDDGNEVALAELIVRYDDDPGEQRNIVMQRVPAQSATSAGCDRNHADYNFRVREGELFLDSPGANDSEGDGEVELQNNRLTNTPDHV